MKIRETVKQICEKFDQFGKDLQFEVGRFTGVYRVRPVPRPLRTENVDWRQVLFAHNPTPDGHWGWALKNNKSANFTYAYANDNAQHDTYLGGELPSFPGTSKYDLWEQWGLSRYVCMDYAVADVALRHLRKKYGSYYPHAAERAMAFSDRNKFESLLKNRRWAERFNNKAMDDTVCPEAYRVKVPINGGTDFFYDELRALQEKLDASEHRRDERTFYVLSTNHAMTLTLKVKKLPSLDEQNRYRYSINFYDPNRTYNHKKFRSSNLDDFKDKPISGWLIHPLKACLYNQRRPNPRDPVQQGEWMFSEVPDRVIESVYD